jgi:hypothetical protein
MKLILLFFFILLIGCSPSQSHIRGEIEKVLGFENFAKKGKLNFKYTHAHSSHLYFSVYQISKSDFQVFKEYLTNKRGFSEFESSNNGFDVHHAFPEENIWNNKAEYAQKKIDSNQQRYSLFYLIESETLIVEYASSR